MNEQELAMLAAINAARVERGVHALAAEGRLAAAARVHAADMGAHPGLVHVGSDGSTIEERVRRAGYAPARWGEVVAWGWQGEVGPAVAWWLASPDHVGYVLSADFTEIGVGYAVGAGPWGHYWVVDLGRPVDGAPPAPPRPYVSYAPVVVGAPTGGPGGIDLLPYLCGDGRAYRVGNQRGTFEVFQSQVGDGRFYQVKAWDDLSVVHWEEFVVSGEFIGRDVDTSPGGGRFYRQFGAPWVRRWMRPGERFAQGKRVQFYRLDGCDPVEASSGNVTDTIELVEQLRGWRSVFGVEVEDAITLRWVEGGEWYTYGRGWGLVGWRRAHADEQSPVWSAVSELRPGVGRLERLRVGCLE